jgi:hypothetical protein
MDIYKIKFENLQEAQKLDTEINNRIQHLCNGEKDTRLMLERKILQHYLAFSCFDVPFCDWIKKYLKDLL